MIDAELLARATFETTGERLEKWEREARASGRLTGVDEFEGPRKTFDEIPESSRVGMIEQAEAAAQRYMELASKARGR